jgi:hypothetical protein
VSKRNGLKRELNFGLGKFIVNLITDAVLWLMIIWENSVINRAKERGSCLILVGLLEKVDI